MRDHGYALELPIHGWLSIPRGASEAVFARGQAACRVAVQAPEGREAFRGMAVLPMCCAGAAHAERLKGGHLAVGAIVRAAGVQRQD